MGPLADLANTNLASVGYLATTEEEFADGFAKALSLRDPLSMRKRARQSAKRFAEEVFAKKWISQMEILVGMAR